MQYIRRIAEKNLELKLHLPAPAAKANSFEIYLCTMYRYSPVYFLKPAKTNTQNV